MVSVCLPSDALSHTYHLTWVSLTLDVGYLFIAAPAKCSRCSLPWMGEVVKQEMVRVHIDILGISALKWTGMGEFNSGDHCIYYCRQESLRRNGVAIMVNKRV